MALRMTTNKLANHTLYFRVHKVFINAHRQAIVFTEICTSQLCAVRLRLSNWQVWSTSISGLQMLCGVAHAGTEIMTSDDEEDLCETKQQQQQQQQQQQHEFVLKVIDWEEAFFEGEVIPLHIVTAHIEDRYRRYTLSQYNSLMGRNRILAACWMDHWMADTIYEFLSEDR